MGGMPGMGSMGGMDFGDMGGFGGSDDEEGACQGRSTCCGPRAGWDKAGSCPVGPGCSARPLASWAEQLSSSPAPDAEGAGGKAGEDSDDDLPDLEPVPQA